MINLKTETLEVIKESGHTVEDIDWCGISGGSDNFKIPTDVFFDIIDFEYNNGYGLPEINSYLTVMFTDGTWLERGEYDGSEWWKLRKVPEKPNGTKSTSLVKSDIYFKSSIWGMEW